MKKLTLQFLSLSELAAFSKYLTNGYLLNTNNLTITAAIPDRMVIIATEQFHATVIETTDKVFSYELIR